MLLDVLNRFEISTVIFNGDTKHFTYGVNKQELEEIQYFFNDKKFNKLNFYLILGNHDKLLKLSLQKIFLNNCQFQEFYFTESKSFIHHGHEILIDKYNDFIVKSNYIILSHEHPSFYLKGSNGIKMKLPAFAILKVLIDNLEKIIIILPAANNISLGNAFPPINGDTLLSPFLREHCLIKNIKMFPYDSEIGTFPIPEINLNESMKIK